MTLDLTKFNLITIVTDFKSEFEQTDTRTITNIIENIKTKYIPQILTDTKTDNVINPGNSPSEGIPTNLSSIVKEDKGDVATLAHEYYKLGGSNIRIGSIVAGNAGRPGGATGGKDGVVANAVRFGHNTMEEDIVSNWLLTSTGGARNKKTTWDTEFTKIKDRWGLKNPSGDGSDQNTIQGVNFNNKLKPSDYYQAWGPFDVTVSKQIYTGSQPTYDYKTPKIPICLVFVAGPNNSIAGAPNYMNILTKDIRGSTNPTEWHSVRRTFDGSVKNDYNYYKNGIANAIMAGLDKMIEHKIDVAIIPRVGCGIYAGEWATQINDDFLGLVQIVASEKYKNKNNKNNKPRTSYFRRISVVDFNRTTLMPEKLHVKNNEKENKAGISTAQIAYLQKRFDNLPKTDPSNKFIVFLKIQMWCLKKYLDKHTGKKVVIPADPSNGGPPNYSTILDKGITHNPSKPTPANKKQVKVKTETNIGSGLAIGIDGSNRLERGQWDTKFPNKGGTHENNPSYILFKTALDFEMKGLQKHSKRVRFGLILSYDDREYDKDFKDTIYLWGANKGNWFERAGNNGSGQAKVVAKFMERDDKHLYDKNFVGIISTPSTDTPDWDNIQQFITHGYIPRHDKGHLPDENDKKEFYTKLAELIGEYTTEK
jgi:hypothetical protein